MSTGTNKERIEQNNLQLENIKNEVSNLPDFIDTSNATATAEDILTGKTAYANGEKLIGTMPENLNNAFIDFGTSTTTMYIYEYIKSIGQLDTSNVTSMAKTFYNCSRLTTISLLNTSKVTSMSETFYNCSGLTTIPLLNTSKVTRMDNTFFNCSKLKEIPQLDTSNVTDMHSTFYNCYELTIVPLLDTSKVTSMRSTFYNCYKLTTIPLLNTSNVTDMTTMFYGCYELKTVPLLDTSNVTSMGNMFNFCPLLSDESLNNILAMCTNAVKITSDKTLSYIGLNSEQAAKCQSLSNYQAFLDAGWTTGY